MDEPLFFGRMPTGRLIAAARVLAGLTQRELAEKAGLDAATIVRMEGFGEGRVRSNPESVERVVNALAGAGVAILPDGVRVLGATGI
jgi:transcriptional regulator with XRE-family HTH domain